MTTPLERARLIRADQLAHNVAGRIVGTAPVTGATRNVTFCSCGLAFIGLSVAGADNRCQVHIRGEDQAVIVDEP